MYHSMKLKLRRFRQNEKCKLSHFEDSNLDVLTPTFSGHIELQKHFLFIKNRHEVRQVSKESIRCKSLNI